MFSVNCIDIQNRLTNWQLYTKWIYNINNVGHVKTKNKSRETTKSENENT